MEFVRDVFCLAQAKENEEHGARPDQGHVRSFSGSVCGFKVWSNFRKFYRKTLSFYPLPGFYVIMEI
jgi:hypothetical protein